jgi:hypothetical protein
VNFGRAHLDLCLSASQGDSDAANVALGTLGIYACLKADMAMRWNPTWASVNMIVQECPFGIHKISITEGQERVGKEQTVVMTMVNGGKLILEVP